MNDPKTPLEIALSDPRMPWPSSIEDEIMLAEHRLAAEGHGPARMRKTSEVSRVLDLLDEIGKDGPA